MTTWPRAMPALVTALDPSGDLDVEGHRHNIAVMVERGARGVLLAGSTGEGPYLDVGERAALVTNAKEVDASLTILCGINAESVRQGAAQIREATQAGADAVLVITPTTLARKDPGAIERFYVACAESSEVPVFLYNVPAVSSLVLTVDQVRNLAGHERIVGMKDSGGEPERLDGLADLIADGFTVFTGASRALLASHHAGAWGAITASANYALTEVSLASRGDAAAQQRLTAIAGSIEEHGVAGTKAAATATGLHAGPPRPPLRSVDPTEAAQIVGRLRAAGLVSTQ